MQRLFGLARWAKRRLMVRTRMRATATRMLRTRGGLRYLQDFYWDYRFGGSCGGKLRNPYELSGATEIQSSHYAILDAVLAQVPVLADDVVVDVGCGKGRVINWWLRNHITNRIIGIEIVEEIADETRRRLLRFSNVTIIRGDAIASLPQDGTLFYLFNPFGPATVEAFAQRLATMHREGNGVRVIYLNCRYADVFDTRYWQHTELHTGVRERALLLTLKPSPPEAAIASSRTFSNTL